VQNDGPGNTPGDCDYATAHHLMGTRYSIIEVTASWFARSPPGARTPRDPPEHARAGNHRHKLGWDCSRYRQHESGFRAYSTHYSNDRRAADKNLLPPTV